MKNKLDQLFREKLARHREAPSPQAWEQLHHALAARRRKLWLRRLAVAAAVALLFTVAFSLTRVQNPQKQSEQANGAPLAQSMKKQPFSHEENIAKVEAQAAQPERENTPTEKESEHKKATTPVKHEVPQTVTKPPEQEPALAEAAVEGHEKAPVFHGKKVIIVLEKPSEDGSRPAAEEGMKNHEKSIKGQNALLADASEQDAPIMEKTEKKADKIVIVYKKDKNRRPVKKVFDNSLGKLARLYDQKLMTEDVKTDLNTLKKDVLAWRVDKLFSKKD